MQAQSRETRRVGNDRSRLLLKTIDAKSSSLKLMAASAEPCSSLFSLLHAATNSYSVHRRSQDFEEGGAMIMKEGAKQRQNNVIINSWAWPNLLFA